jgi:hypothetical protein
VALVLGSARSRSWAPLTCGFSPASCHAFFAACRNSPMNSLMVIFLAVLCAVLQPSDSSPVPGKG